MAQTSALEQWLLELINKARLDPEGVTRAFGVPSLNDGLAPGTISSAPKAALVMSETLQLSADFHGDYSLERGSFETTGYLGSNPGERMAYAGFGDGEAFDWAETLNWRIFPAQASVSEATVLYNIWVDLIRAPDTRSIILGDYNQVGVSFLNDLLGTAPTERGYVVTNDYGKTDQVFITGGTYHDMFSLDHNIGPASGNGGVKIVAAGTSTTSRDTGGYAIEVAAGLQNIRLGKVSLTVAVADENIKIDVVGSGYVRSDHSITVNAGASIVELMGKANIDIRLVATSGALQLLGNAGDNRLTGSNTNNFLDGREGADTMLGGNGNDRYWVDNVGDVVIEKIGGGAEDIIETKVSYTLKAGSEVEYVMADRGMFYEEFTLIGNELSQTLVTNLGNDILDGGGGGDILSGSTGDDLYFIGHASDQIDEYNAEGTDTARSFISFTLADDDSIENLFTDNFFGKTAIDLTGNGLDQTIRGNAAANRLSGLGGNDILDGKAGGDFIYGGAGNDRLIGGLGKDLLSGGSGADRFYFTDAAGAANADTAVDFVKGEDSIYLEKDVFTGLTGNRLASAAFKNLALGTKDADDRIIFDQGNLYFDIDGSGQADAQLFAQLTNGAVVSSADFWLA